VSCGEPELFELFELFEPSLEPPMCGQPFWSPCCGAVVLPPSSFVDGLCVVVGESFDDESCA
jgi:hypothetical protein